jgi:transposase
MTSTTEETPLILKTDVLGRVYMPKERRETILDAYECSAMSGQAFAAHVGVKYPTLATWLQRRRKRDAPTAKGSTPPPPPPLPIALFEAVVESGSTDCEGALEVETAQGVKFQIRSKADVALAADLLRALSQGRGC